MKKILLEIRINLTSKINSQKNNNLEGKFSLTFNLKHVIISGVEYEIKVRR